MADSITMVKTAPILMGTHQSSARIHIEAQVQRAITRIAESDCPVLIVGEQGVGKRSIAAQIHAHSNRSRRPLNEIDCATAQASTLLAALAENGTVYLKEIAELSLANQDLIINGYFLSDQVQSSRLLCSTSRELVEEVKACRMREDFYYFASAVMLRISPLRCQRTKILVLADELLTRYSKQFDRPKPVLGEEIVDFLLEHTWPDNMPELETAIKTFVAIGDQSISLAALKAAAPALRVNGRRTSFSLKQATREASAQIERQLISEVLIATGGNRKRAADKLGISYKALLYKLKQAGADAQPIPQVIGEAR